MAFITVIWTKPFPIVYILLNNVISIPKVVNISVHTY